MNNKQIELLDKVEIRLHETMQLLIQIDKLIKSTKEDIEATGLQTMLKEK